MADTKQPSIISLRVFIGCMASMCIGEDLIDDHNADEATVQLWRKLPPGVAKKVPGDRFQDFRDHTGMVHLFWDDTAENREARAALIDDLCEDDPDKFDDGIAVLESGDFVLYGGAKREYRLHFPECTRFKFVNAVAQATGSTMDPETGYYYA